MSEKSERLSAILPASTENMEILRGNFLLSGTDGDHTTAFAVLKKTLTTAFELSHNASQQVSRVTPVLKQLTRMVDAEMDLLENSEAIRSEELLSKLDKLAKEIDKQAESLAKIDKNYKPQKYNPQAIGGSNKIKEAVEFIKDFFSGQGSRDRQNVFKGQLKEFLKLYSQAIPYLNLNELRETLDGVGGIAENRAKALAEKLKEDVLKQIENSPSIETMSQRIKEMPDTDPNKRLLQEDLNKLKAESFKAQVDVHFAYAGREFARKTVEQIISDYSEIMNQLPSAAYLKFSGVSGKNRHGGGAVISAMKGFQKAVDSGKIEDAVIYMALLLDFHPLLQSAVENRAKETTIQTNNVNGSLDTRAARIAATRDNNPNTLAYVIAKHWKAMNDAFPALRSCKEREEIRNKFIDHMITRWRLADRNPSATQGDTAFEQEEAETIDRINGGNRWEPTNIVPSGFENRVRNLIDSSESLSLSPPSRTLSAAFSHQPSSLSNSNSSSSSSASVANSTTSNQKTDISSPSSPAPGTTAANVHVSASSSPSPSSNVGSLSSEEAKRIETQKKELLNALDLIGQGSKNYSINQNSDNSLIIKKGDVAVGQLRIQNGQVEFFNLFNPGDKFALLTADQKYVNLLNAYATMTAQAPSLSSSSSGSLVSTPPLPSHKDSSAHSGAPMEMSSASSSSSSPSYSQSSLSMSAPSSALPSNVNNSRLTAQFINSINAEIEKLNNFRKEMQGGHLADLDRSWQIMKNRTLAQLGSLILNRFDRDIEKIQELHHAITEIDKEIATVHAVANLKNQTTSTVFSSSHSTSSSSSSFSVTDATTGPQDKRARTKSPTHTVPDSPTRKGLALFRNAATRVINALKRKRSDSPTTVTRGDLPTNTEDPNSMKIEGSQSSSSMSGAEDVSQVHRDLANSLTRAKNVLEALRTTENPEHTVTFKLDASVAQQLSSSSAHSSVREEEMRSRTPTPPRTNQGETEGSDTLTPPASPSKPSMPRPGSH